MINNGAYVAIISHKRAQNIERMMNLVGKATWYVGEGEGLEYRAGGATKVVESGGLVASRNRPLDDAFALGLPCIEISDDLTRFSFLSEKKAKPVNFPAVLSWMMDQNKSGNAKLIGVAPTANPYFGSDNIKTKAFCVGDFFMAWPSEPRFDERASLKEDYDFTCQHLQKYGEVARHDYILATFGHRTNKGGAVDYRTAELEQEAIKYLKTKWGDRIKDNPRRPNEILLKWHE